MKSYENPLHIVSAKISELGITFAQKSVSGKSNEIPAVPELIGELEIRGCMVIAHAFNCQKKTAEVLVKGKAYYLLCTKNNQGQDTLILLARYQINLISCEICCIICERDVNYITDWS